MSLQLAKGPHPALRATFSKEKGQHHYRPLSLERVDRAQRETGEVSF